MEILGDIKVKIIHLEITKCNDCPYRRYNSDLDCYECSHEYESQYIRPNLLWEDQFIKGFPEWCPLEDRNE